MCAAITRDCSGAQSPEFSMLEIRNVGARDDRNTTKSLPRPMASLLGRGRCALGYGSKGVFGLMLTNHQSPRPLFAVRFTFFPGRNTIT